MSRGSHAFIFLLILLATTLGAGTEPAGDTAIFLRYNALNGQVERASRAVAARHFEEARRLLEPCLIQVPDHFEAHFLLARMAYEVRDFAGALSHLERSKRSLAELDRKYREEMGALAAQAEAEETAIQSSLDNLYARGADPSGCSASLFQVKQNDLAFLEAKKGNLHKSENPFEIPAEYHFLHGNCLYRLGRRGEALAQYRLAVQQDRAHENAWNNLISLQWEARAYVEARADLERAEAAHVAIRPDLKKAVLAGASAATPAPRHAGGPATSADQHR